MAAALPAEKRHPDEVSQIVSHEKAISPRANQWRVLSILPSTIDTGEGGLHVLVELDDLIVARLQKLAEREGISLDETLENLLALYGATCD